MRFLNMLVICTLVLAAAAVYKIKFDSTLQGARVGKLSNELRTERDAKNVLTMRSSSEWNETTTSRPPTLSMRSAAASAATNSPSSSLTKIRKA